MKNISFLIPVFNAEKYIYECINSIERINFGKLEYEIICIDDCSKDNSFKIMKEKIKTNNRIRVYKNENNKGVSYTRNRLLKLAEGEFVWFIDADDCVLNFNFEEFYKAILDYNFICVDFTNEKTNLETNLLFVEKTLDNIDFLNSMFCICRFIFRRNFLLLNNVLFKNEISCYEDVLFFFICRENEKRILYCNKKLYYYRVNLASCCHTILLGKAIKNVIMLLDELQKLKRDEEIETEIKIIQNMVTNWLLKCKNNKEAIKYYKISKSNKLLDKNFFNKKSLKGKILQRVLENRIGFFCLRKRIKNK